VLTPAAFFRDAHRRIFERIIDEARRLERESAARAHGDGASGEPA